MDIKTLTIDDYEDSLALWKRTKGLGLSSADSRESIMIFLERNPGLSFCAKDSDRLVGTVLAGHDGRRGFLYHLAIDSDYRRRGLGRSLVSKSVEALKAAGIQKSHIFTIKKNRLGGRFWEALGWFPRNDIQIRSKVL